MNDKSKNYLIAILIVVIIILVSVLIYFFINNDKKNTSDDKTSNVENKSNDNSADMTETNDDEKYNTYTSVEFKGMDPETDKEYTVTLNVTSGTLVATEDGKAMKVNGIDGSIQSFTYANHEDVNIIVLTKDNTVYQGSYSLLGGRGQSLQFKKITLNKKVLGITNDECLCGEETSQVTLIALDDGTYKEVTYEGELEDVQYDEKTCVLSCEF